MIRLPASTHKKHIEVLTQGLVLPLPPISKDHLKLIADILSEAFMQVKQQELVTVEEGDESAVSSLLHSKLVYLIDSDLLVSQVLSNVTRGGETYNFDGRKHENRPDFSLCLTGRANRFPLLVEAKLIDHAKKKTVKLYGDNGIRRFITGDYGWASQEAFMLAYVRGNETLSDTLTPHLKQVGQTDPAHYQLIMMPEPLQMLSESLAVSQHNRPFTYIHVTPPHPPGAITLWHLWLK
jgi:hypothetical protein